MIDRFVTVLALVLAAAGTVAGQHSEEMGLPFITNYGVRDYDAGGFNWAITQDQRGIMYFGNQWGVLEFDGTNWHLIRLTNESTVRSLDVDAEDRVWVGGVRELGYLQADSVGRLSYVSLVPQLSEEVRDFTDVWHTYAMDDGVYFFTDTYVFRFSDDGVKTWTSDNAFHVAFKVDDELYVREWETGLMRLDDDGLKLVPGGDRFHQERIYVMLPYDEGRSIVVTRTMGVFLFDEKTFEPFKTEIDDWLARHLIYLPGTRLRDGGYAFASISGGVAIINHDGSLRQIVDQSTGIPDNGVIYTYQDRAGDLWFGMTDGISRVGIGSPYSVFDERSGFASRLTDVIRYNGDLFAASQSGFYRFDRESRTWIPVPGTNNQTFSFEVMEGRLLVAAGLEGLYEYRDGRLTSVKRAIDNSFSVGFIQQSVYDSTRVFLGLLGGIGSMRLVDGQWIDEGVLPDYDYNRFFVEEQSKDVIWTAGPEGPVNRITLAFDGDTLVWDRARIEPYGRDKGSDENGSGISKIGDHLYAVLDYKWIRYDPATDSFVRAPELDEIQLANSGGGFAVDPNGKYWLSGGANIAILTVGPDGSFDIDSHRFDALTEFRPGAMEIDNDGITWIVTIDGVVRYDPGADHTEEAFVASLIRSVSVGADSLIFAGSLEKSSPKIAFDHNSLRFGYTSTNFQNADLNRFQTRLVGFEDSFTEWGPDTRREFTNLNPGKYTFEVKTKTAAGIESAVASYSFSILPPWYRTWWAYSLYGLGFLVLFGGFVGLRTRQLHARQRELEKTVEERTAEINQRVEELAVINSVQEGLVAEMDIQGIYDLVGDRIRDLFDAQVVVIRTFDWDAGLETWHYAIEKGERLQVPPREIPSMFNDLRETVVINDNFRDYIAQYDARPVPAGGEPKSAVFVPLMVGDQVRGNVSLQNVDRENAFSDSDVRLLSTLSNSMSVALENARLFDQTNHLLEESDQRAEELTTVNRISKALVAQLDLDALIDLIGSHIQELFKADMAYVAIHNKETGMIDFPFGYGDDFPPIEFGEGFTSQIIQTGRPLLINEDVSGSFQEMGIEEIGKSSASYLGVPVSVGSEVIGVISVQSESQTGRFDDDDQRLLSTIAANVGVALQNAESYRKLNETLSDLKSTQEQLVTQEKMASLGQLTAGIAHEIKNPLNFVNNFAELIAELAKEAGDLFDKNREQIPDELAEEIIPMMSGLAVNARQVHKHGKRADGIVKNMMDHARGGSGERYRVEVNPMVEEYLQLAYHGMKAQVPDLDVEMRKDFDPTVGTLDMAPREIGRVIVNLVNNAIYAVHEKSLNVNGNYQPQVTVKTSKQNGSVQITVADNGPGIPTDVREKIFEPLFTTKPTGSGTGLGLSLSFDIVTQAHGGRLDFDSNVGDGTTFTVTLPTRG